MACAARRSKRTNPPSATAVLVWIGPGRIDVAAAAPRKSYAVPPGARPNVRPGQARGRNLPPTRLSQVKRENRPSRLGGATTAGRSDLRAWPRWMTWGRAGRSALSCTSAAFLDARRRLPAPSRATAGAACVRARMSVRPPAGRRALAGPVRSQKEKNDLRRAGNRHGSFRAWLSPSATPPVTLIAPRSLGLCSALFSRGDPAFDAAPRALRPGPPRCRRRLTGVARILLLAEPCPAAAGRPQLGRPRSRSTRARRASSCRALLLNELEFPPAGERDVRSAQGRDPRATRSSRAPLATHVPALCNRRRWHASRGRRSESLRAGPRRASGGAPVMRGPRSRRALASPKPYASGSARDQTGRGRARRRGIARRPRSAWRLEPVRLARKARRRASPGGADGQSLSPRPEGSVERIRRSPAAAQPSRTFASVRASKRSSCSVH